MNKYLRAISANFIFFSISTIFFLAITPVAIKVMGEEFYGLWVILNAILLFSNIGSMGMNVIISKFASEQVESIFEKRSIITSGFVIIFPAAAFIAGVLFFTRFWFARRMNLPVTLQLQLEQSIAISALSLFPQFLGRVPQGYLLAQYRNGLVRLIESGGNILIWVGAVLVALNKKDLVLMATWGAVVQFASMLIYLFAAAPSGAFRWKFDVNVLKKMLNFSGFNLITTFSTSLYQQLDRILVGLTLGPAVAGVYSVGTSVGLRLPIIVGQITEIMVPYASSKQSLSEREKLFDVFKALSRLVSFLLAILSGLLIIWMAKILEIWISPGYADAYTGIFQILILAYVILGLARPAHQTLTGIGHVKFTSLVYLGSSVLMLAGVYYFSLSFGVQGAVTANLLMLGLLTFNIFAYKILAGKIPWKVVLKDLGWGLILPVMIYIVIHVDTTIITKIITTFALLLIVAFGMYSDRSTKGILSNFLRPISDKVCRKGKKNI